MIYSPKRSNVPETNIKNVCITALLKYEYVGGFQIDFEDVHKIVNVNYIDINTSTF